ALGGGETALPVVDGLGHPTLAVESRLCPLVVRTRLLSGPYAGLPLVTKGGSAGAPDLLGAIVRQLGRGARCWRWRPAAWWRSSTLYGWPARSGSTRRATADRCRFCAARASSFRRSRRGVAAVRGASSRKPLRRAMASCFPRAGIFSRLATVKAAVS